jgi:type I restriction enzyme S subunit
VDGPFGSELQRKDYIDAGIPVLKIQNIKPFAIELKKMDYVSPTKFHELRRHSFRRGDIVLTKLGSPLGVSAIVEDVEEGVIVADLVRIRAEKINTKFLCYQLNSESTSEFINSKQKGTTRPRVTLSAVRELPIAVPSLSEQQRIVGILDAAFEGIATAKANAEQNLRNARALFESHLDSALTESGPGWEERRFDEVCSITSTLVDPRKDEYRQLIHVGAGNIQPKTGALIELKTGQEEGLISGKFLFDESMVLYSKIRPYLMKVARPDFSGLCSADMYPLSPNPDVANRDFLFHLLLSKHFTDYAILGSARAGMPKVNREHLFEFRVSLPSVKVQQRIASGLDKLHEDTKRLASLYVAKLQQLDALKKSLLHQAFGGQL